MKDWQGKEKELTQEEAVALAKKELAPYWLGSPPLFIGVKKGNQDLVLPLGDGFVDKSWVILFSDATEFNSGSSQIYLKEWTRRYASLDLSFLNIGIPSYQFMKKVELIQKQKVKQSILVAIDFDDTISRAFKVTQAPKILLYGNKKIYFENEGENWLENAELTIQKFLRSREAGLPLFPIFQPPVGTALSKDSRRVEFGFKPKFGKQADFLPSTFSGPAEEERSGHFKEGRPELLDEKKVFISGKWKQDAERITTSDPEASIVFAGTSARISIICQTVATPADVGLISVEVDNLPAYDKISGENIAMDDVGRSLVRVTVPQLYHILSHLPVTPVKTVSLRFPQAKSVPIALYGIRFGE